tara:strand:+ start:4229 stop:5197 length:969 start_codon:yes stop_codon:yes gene_type:complete
LKFVIIIIIFLFNSFAQSQSSNYFYNAEKKIESSEFNINNDAFKAFVLSAIIPGAGQFYNKNYKRGIAYLAFEIINWSKRSTYLDKGDNFVAQYKDFANNHWSFDRWIRDINLIADSNHPVNSVMLGPDGNFFYPWNDSHHIEFYLDGYLRRTNNSNGDNWFENTYKTVCNEAINNFQECITSEFVNIDGSSAVVTKDHHFYEGIGKYDLFFAGWDDTQYGECDQSTIDQYGSCSYILLTNNTENAYTDNKRYYQYELRDKANKNYDVAENALTFIFINHAISMLDAFIVNLVSNKSSINYMTQPLYDNNIKLNGLEISILW